MVKMLLPYYKKVTKMGSIIGQRITLMEKGFREASSTCPEEIDYRTSPSQE